MHALKGKAWNDVEAGKRGEVCGTENWLDEFFTSTLWKASNKFHSQTLNVKRLLTYPVTVFSRLTLFSCGLVQWAYTNKLLFAYHRGQSIQNQLTAIVFICFMLHDKPLASECSKAPSFQYFFARVNSSVHFNSFQLFWNLLYENFLEGKTSQQTLNSLKSSTCISSYAVKLRELKGIQHEKARESSTKFKEHFAMKLFSKRKAKVDKNEAWKFTSVFYFFSQLLLKKQTKCAP